MRCVYSPGRRLHSRQGVFSKICGLCEESLLYWFFQIPLCPHSLEQDALSCYSQISVRGKPDGYNVIFSLMLPNVSATI